MAKNRRSTLFTISFQERDFLSCLTPLPSPPSSPTPARARRSGAEPDEAMRAGVLAGDVGARGQWDSRCIPRQRTGVWIGERYLAVELLDRDRPRPVVRLGRSGESNGGPLAPDQGMTRTRACQMRGHRPMGAVHRRSLGLVARSQRRRSATGSDSATDDNHTRGGHFYCGLPRTFLLWLDRHGVGTGLTREPRLRYTHIFWLPWEGPSSMAVSPRPNRGERGQVC